MDLVHHNNVAPPALPPICPPGNLLFQFGDSVRGRVEGDKGMVGEQIRKKPHETGLSRARRTEEDHGWPTALGKEGPKDAFRSQKMFLPHHLIKGERSHAIGKRSPPLSLVKKGTGRLHQTSFPSVSVVMEK
jgi:hypothetical protein